MVKDQLEQLTMVRLALDVGSAMQYLAEAGFVVRLPLRLRLRLHLFCVFVCVFVWSVLLLPRKAFSLLLLCA
jgi:hypothetical protein